MKVRRRIDSVYRTCVCTLIMTRLRYCRVVAYARGSIRRTAHGWLAGATAAELIVIQQDVLWNIASTAVDQNAVQYDYERCVRTTLTCWSCAVRPHSPTPQPSSAALAATQLRPKAAFTTSALPSYTVTNPTLASQWPGWTSLGFLPCSACFTARSSYVLHAGPVQARLVYILQRERGGTDCDHIVISKLHGNHQGSTSHYSLPVRRRPTHSLPRPIREHVHPQRTVQSHQRYKLCVVSCTGAIAAAERAGSAE